MRSGPTLLTPAEVVPVTWDPLAFIELPCLSWLFLRTLQFPASNARATSVSLKTTVTGEPIAATVAEIGTGPSTDSRERTKGRRQPPV